MENLNKNLIKILNEMSPVGTNRYFIENSKITMAKIDSIKIDLSYLKIEVLYWFKVKKPSDNNDWEFVLIHPSNTFSSREELINSL